MSEHPTGTPRVFVSHASEDKVRFVTKFATKLRAAGVDAWVDQWEIGPGDSLVQRIFDEGLDGADAFVVVLSNVSVTKPWVREELDAAVVRLIDSTGKRKIIPVVIDEGVVVPAPLKHRLWVSVPDDGFDAVAGKVVAAIFGQQSKPPIGPAPTYTSSSLKWTKTPVDETVFRLVVSFLTAHDDGHGWVLWSNDVENQALDAGLTKEQFHESMHALTQARLIDAQVTVGGVRWLLGPLPDSVLLGIAEEKGADIASVERAALASIINDGRKRFSGTEFGVSFRTMGAILELLQSKRLITYSTYTSGAGYIHGVQNVSPLAGRALVEMESREV